MSGKPYIREPDGLRFKPGSINTVKAVDQLTENEYAYLQNVRAYLQDRITGRATMGSPIAASSPGSASVSSGTAISAGGPPSASAWTNPSNIFSGSPQPQTTINSSPFTSQYLQVSNLGFAIPIGSIITGIQFSLQQQLFFGSGQSLSVQPTSSGALVGVPIATPLSGGTGPLTIGGLGNLFSFPWTPALINGTNGLGVWLQAFNGSSFGSPIVLSQLVVTVYYSAPGAPFSLLTPIHSIRRLNDSTPSGPLTGYLLVTGAAAEVYANGTPVANGFSGNPISLVPFRPNTSVAPWMYIGDSSQATQILSNGFANCAGMMKVRSDGLIYKTGIKEPQVIPLVSTANTTTGGTDVLAATSFPWTNTGGVNPSYNYGQTAGGTAPVIIATPVYGSTVKIISVAGIATINGNAAATPSTSQVNTNVFPGYYVYPGAHSPSSLVIGAFTDSSGNVVAGSVATPNPVDVSAGGTFTVPFGATQFQVGIDSQGNTFGSNSGSFTLQWQVTTAAIATHIVTLGQVTAYSWGDSPHSGPVSAYIWKNPNDTGSGVPRSIGTAQATTQSNSWEFDSTPQDGTVFVSWNTVDSTGTVTGSIPMFSTSLEPSNYPNQDFNNFNSCIVGSIFVPAAGTYAFSLQYKDQIMFGIGGGAVLSGNVTTTGGGHGTITETPPFTGHNGQTKTVVSGLPLTYVGFNNSTTGSSTFQTSTFNINIPAAGAYQVEIDWDYWFHTGRSLYMKVNSATIPALTIAARVNVSYAYKYRSSKTGAVSNPSPLSPVAVTPVLDNTVKSEWSNDPQVDLVDYYRQDSGLSNYTYVATGPNDGLGGLVGGIIYNTAITDSLSDAAASANQIMQIDDFEPFPSIDLPKSGVVNVASGVITWVSGDHFNIRWLPGTIIEIGSPTQQPYSLIARPTSSTSITIPGVPDGSNLAYNIAEPGLAAQPLPSIWGPTDNSAYMFGCYDPLRPGTLYFTKGNNPDSAPDTNQIEVTSPSEPLMNGCIINGIGMVFSTERAWLIFPTFATALATVSGVQGQVFNLIESIANRGLYIRTCLCSEAGLNAFFRAKDGIYVSEGGAGSTSITDAQIYNLFPHEGFLPQPVTIAGQTVYPPDDTQPNAQKLAFANGYLYYDYLNVNGTPCTLVFDVAARGWSVDIYNPTVTVHALEEGQSVNDTIVGVSDGTLRRLTSSGIEVVTSIVGTRCIDAGDARATKRLGDIFVKALIANSSAVTAQTYQNRYATLVSATGSLAGNGSLTNYIVDIPTGFGQILTDVEMLLSWNTVNNTILELWQPDFIPQPETIQDQPSEWDDAGSPGNKFVQGLLLECDTLGAAKTFSVERSDDNTLIAPVEVPFSQSGHSIRSFTFNPPFTAHLLRRISTDGVPWLAGPSGGWTLAWIVEPYPEASTVWTTEASAFGLLGWIHLYQVNLAYISTQPVTLTATTDQGPFTLTFPAGGSGLQPAKILMKAPRNKWKVCSFSVTSGAAFYLWKDLCEVWLKPWGSTAAYEKINPFGSATALMGAAI